jgi:hypothetical protein
VADKYTDLLIEGDGIALDAFGFPRLINGRASIAQDIKHMIRETGLLIEMIGERHAEKVQRKMIQIERYVEDDERITPGTAKVTRTDNETFFITAKTIEYGDVEFYL